ncbi:hypothetical protein XH80_25175 [Bradyrhizobium sp. CCBAU 45384]|nr:hypothetical protein [Bradyrhizobium sp. CCBAU 45384]
MPHQQIFHVHQTERKRIHLPVALFLISLVVPWVIYFGPLRMSVYRFFLLAMFLPCMAMWLGGKAGRVRTSDLALLLYSFWAALSLAIIHGFEATSQSSGIIFIETLGPYLVARCYIRDADDFYNAFSLLFRIVVLLLPFGVVELLSGVNISRELFAAILPTFTDAMPPRMGLTRVQSVFDHPILFGVITGSILAPVHLVLGCNRDLFQRLLMTGVVAGTSMLSVSSGPLTALIAQAFLLCWNGLFGAIRSRWKILIAILAVSSLVIELTANRSLLDIVVGYFLFDPGSYWYRKLIWTYGTESALNHPLFGTGLNPWERPQWMTPSIDNFWLFHAVRYGLPAGILMPLAFFSVYLAVCFKKGLDAREDECRTAFLITMTGFFLVAWTVHFWDAAYVMLTFFMGSGVWMLDVTPNKTYGWEEHGA